MRARTRSPHQLHLPQADARALPSKAAAGLSSSASGSDLEQALLPKAPAPPMPRESTSAPKETPHWVLTTIYGLTNLSSVVMIVVANKMVLFTYKFHFVVTLTLLHSVFTAVGMAAMAAAGVFQVKTISWKHSVPVAAVYVGFIVFNNLSIQINPLGELVPVSWLVCWCVGCWVISCVAAAARCVLGGR